ncbi:hypothetical protein CYLTODRAFT_427461 [Cylindrobasidium torrendii FP15055 ss-10]|uniref:BZIP domain-containing protein n=1 Tax=Cylindrobasidium torrendii FP15055 ss-10 TaxID=1314674 RepID=A0A0D7AUS0_9AGAR|nr:hypothetical protein CYLTODRAFT_427461 [Cylindrobasidium torrendii FP15055 ss-10]
MADNPHHHLDPSSVAKDNNYASDPRIFSVSGLALSSSARNGGTQAALDLGLATMGERWSITAANKNFPFPITSTIDNSTRPIHPANPHGSRTSSTSAGGHTSEDAHSSGSLEPTRYNPRAINRAKVSSSKSLSELKRREQRTEGTRRRRAGIAQHTQDLHDRFQALNTAAMQLEADNHALEKEIMYWKGFRRACELMQVPVRNG